MRDLVEAQRDGKAIVKDLEAPELVLQDDRHLARVARGQRVVHDHARVVGTERDVEVMPARQAVLRDHAEHVVHDAEQSLLDEACVIDLRSEHAGAVSVRLAP